MGVSLQYQRSDFTVNSGDDTGDSRIAYVFETKDGEVLVNLFWEPGNVMARGMVGEIGCLEMGFPLLNPVGDPRKLPKAEVFMDSIIRKLKRGEYE